MEESKQNKGGDANSHDFDYLLVLDFEATCSNSEKIGIQEIIEFPIVIVDIKQNKILEEQEHIFHYYIKPTVNPKLTDFCINLTKIQQEWVDVGLTLKDALTKCEEYITRHTFLQPGNFTFLTCGDFDLNLLQRETKSKQLQYTNHLKNYINIKKYFPKELYNEDVKKWNRAPGMAAMLACLQMQLIGTHHSGLDDSKNIARIVCRLIELGVKFKKSMVKYIK